MKHTMPQKPPTKAYSFRVVVEPDEDVFHAYCPVLKGCHTWGHTFEEALANIQEAVQCHVEALLQAGDSIPTAPAGEVQAEPTLTVAVNV